MAYTNPETMQEIANIIQDFDEEILKDLFRDQINSEDSITGVSVNHFQPLFVAYKKAISIEDVDEDDIETIKLRFNNICTEIVNLICAKYSLNIDMGWLESQFGRLPAITMMLYQFFVLDTFYVVLEGCNNYICNNIDNLYNAFSDVSNNDVSSATNVKTMNIKYAAIVTSMYDVTDYTFMMLDPPSFLECLPESYLPGYTLKRMIDEGYLTGDFVRVFGDIFKANLPLRSKVAFELISRIKIKGYLEYNPTIIHTEDIPDSATEEENTDDDDGMTEVEIITTKGE